MGQAIENFVVDNGEGLRRNGLVILSIGMLCFVLVSILELERYYLNWVSILVMLAGYGVLYRYSTAYGSKSDRRIALILLSSILVLGVALFFTISSGY